MGTGRGGGTFVEGKARDQLGLITRAVDLGINWFDTARQYGDGKSETNIGRCLAKMDTKPIISTKFGVKAEDL
jgi:aryl-alcohol dehydrogenase-like predicted oxidoreductase